MKNKIKVENTIEYNNLYYWVLNDVLKLQETLDVLVTPFIEEKNKEVIRTQSSLYWKYYNTISNYKWINSVNKFVFSQINEYYKSFSVFWNITYYKYNKSKDLYADINFLRYKYFEFHNGTYQKNKEVLHYIFLLQFIDFIISRGRLVLEPEAIFETAYSLFAKFLDKLSKTEFLTKFRPIYYYSSILNIELTNNIGISKHFKDYPYSVRFLVYRINKLIKNGWELSHSETVEIIEREIEDRENKIGWKFRKWWAEHSSLVHNIMNVISDYQNISEEDKKALWILKDTGDGEDFWAGGEADSASYEIPELYDPYFHLEEAVKTLITEARLMTRSDADVTVKDQKVWFVIFNLFQSINLDKVLFINKKYGNCPADTFKWIVNIIKSKQGKWIKKVKIPNQKVVELNNAVMRLSAKS